MNLKVAKRMGNLGTETAFEVLAKAKKLEAEGKHIIHLEIGEPDFPTPDNISQAAIKSITGRRHALHSIKRNFSSQRIYRKIYVKNTRN